MSLTKAMSFWLVADEFGPKENRVNAVIHSIFQFLRVLLFNRFGSRHLTFRTFIPVLHNDK